MMMDGVYIVDDQGVRIVVSAEKRPEPGGESHPVSTLVHACVCGSCGYVELWANRPNELWEAFQRNERSRAAASSP
jgi:hypothetical protein